MESKSSETLVKVVSENAFYVPRLGIYPYKGGAPLYLGKEHQLDAGKLAYFEENGSKGGVPFFSSPETFVVKGPYHGQEVQQHLMNSFLTDPSLGLTFVLHRVIYEPEWTQFSFFERNKLPIFLYIVLAWIVCPFLFWWGIRLSNKFQFNFTVDLEGDDVDTLDAVMGDRRRSAQPFVMSSLSMPELERDDPKVQSAAPIGEAPNHVRQVEPEHNSKDSLEPAPHSGVEKKKSEIFESSKVGPLTRRLLEDGPVKNHKESSKDSVQEVDPKDHTMDLMSSSQSDVEKIRQNNIRKSSQSYNRHEGSGKEKDFDCLAGVQSDVLKSLIQKLRDE